MNKKSNTKQKSQSNVASRQQLNAEPLQTAAARDGSALDTLWGRHIDELRSMQFETLSDAVHAIADRVLAELAATDAISQEERAHFVDAMLENEVVSQRLRSMLHIKS
jgi:hypothetical protein